jgi:hypothetical protein
VNIHPSIFGGLCYLATDGTIWAQTARNRIEELGRRVAAGQRGPQVLSAIWAGDLSMGRVSSISIAHSTRRYRCS